MAHSRVLLVRSWSSRGYRRALLRLLGSACCAACDGGEAAPPPTNAPDPRDPSLGDPYYCAESLSDLAPDEPSAFGFTGASVRARIEGEHSASLHWQESAQAYGPETSSSEIWVEASVAPGIQFVDRSVAARPGWVVPEGVTDASFGCRDVLRLQAELSIRSAGLALDEVHEATFEAGPSGIATAQLDLPLASLAGSFSAQLAAIEGFQPARESLLRLLLGMSDAAMAGDLFLRSGPVRSLEGTSEAPGSSERIAHFPSGTGCGPEYVEIGEGQLLRRVGMADALARLNATSPALVASSEGDPGPLLELRFSNIDDSVCRENALPIESGAVFPARVDLASDDGSIAGSLTANVVSLPQLGRVSASASALSDDPEQMGALPASFGIRDAVPFDGYRASSVEFQSGWSENGPWGALSAYGLGSESCLGPDAGAACDNGERTLVWGVHWGIPPSDP